MLQVILLLSYSFIHLLTYSFIVLDKSKSSLFYLKAALLGNHLKLTYLLIHSRTHLITPLDVMTLRCPTCKTPVDPNPDACSAVMCLNCGGHYCNYCFMAFATGKQEDRANCHKHVSTHR